MTKDDYVAIYGDFGGVCDYKFSSPKEKYWLDWLNDKSYTTLFIDGYELKNGEWKKTLRAIFHKYF